MAQTIVAADELQEVLGMAGSTLYPSERYAVVADAAGEYLEGYLDDATLDTIEGGTVPAAVREAGLAIGVELWNHRHAAGGEVQGADFTPSPYRLGRSLIAKVQGLLAHHLDVGSMVG